MENQVIANWKLKNKNKNFVELEFPQKKKKKIPMFNFAITQFSKNRVSYSKLNFLKIKFQNRGIWLYPKIVSDGVFCWKICEKWIKSHFGPQTQQLQHAYCPEVTEALATHRRA